MEGGEVACRVLGVEPGLDGVAVQPDRVLRDGQGLSGGDAQLPLDQVEAGDKFRNRVLDLQAGVHFQEVEAVRRTGPRGFIGDELDRSRADIADRLRRRHRRFTHRFPPAGGEARRGRLLHHLLVPALR